MTEEQVKEMAVKLLVDNRFLDWNYEMGKPTKVNNNCWQIIFRWLPRNEEIFDGYGVIIVNENTGKAYFLESP